MREISNILKMAVVAGLFGIGLAATPALAGDGSGVDGAARCNRESCAHAVYNHERDHRRRENRGYDNGYYNGYENGWNNGYDNSWNNGRNNGWNNGYGGYYGWGFGNLGGLGDCDGCGDDDD